MQALRGSRSILVRYGYAGFWFAAIVVVTLFCAYCPELTATVSRNAPWFNYGHSV